MTFLATYWFVWLVGLIAFLVLGGVNMFMLVSNVGDSSGMKRGFGLHLVAGIGMGVSTLLLILSVVGMIIQAKGS